MTDIVLDTCTLKHAENPDSKYFEHSIELINRMLENGVMCTVDEGFTFEESTNRSYIGLEYTKHLQPGSLGYVLITHLAANLRVKLVSKSINNSKKNYIEQIVTNKKDRMFLRITLNSSDKILASHDFTDYTINKRKEIKKSLKVWIGTAEEINPSL